MFEDRFECKLVESKWFRQSRSVAVNHRGRYAVGERRRSIGCEGEDLVEVHHAEPSQRIERECRDDRAASTDSRINSDGRREPGIDREVEWRDGPRQRCALLPAYRP